MTTELPGGMAVSRIADPNNDLKIVNAARVSMGKRSDRFVLDGTPEHAERHAASGMGSDDGLIRYLARHNHWTPFAQCRMGMRIRTTQSRFFHLMSDDRHAGATMLSPTPNRSEIEFDWIDSVYGLLTRVEWLAALAAPHLAKDFPHTLAAFGITPGQPNHAACTPIPLDRMPMYEPVTLHLKVPVFVARQLRTSGYGIVYNEISRRYVDEEPEYFGVGRWRMRPQGSIKQGSGEDASVELCDMLSPWVQSSEEAASTLYRSMMANGIAPEQARMVLPQSMMVEYWMTANRKRIKQLVQLRTGEHVQRETKLVAKAIGEAAGVDV